MIELSDSEIGLCLNFSYAVTAKTEKYYKLRNTWASTEKLIFDHFSAKLAELAVLRHLTQKGYLVSYPCFKMSKTGDSGSDLTTFSRDTGKILNIHVKCCRFDRFPISVGNVDDIMFCDTSNSCNPPSSDISNGIVPFIRLNDNEIPIIL